MKTLKEKEKAITLKKALQIIAALAERIDDLESRVEIAEEMASRAQDEAIECKQELSEVEDNLQSEVYDVVSTASDNESDIAELTGRMDEVGKFYEKLVE